MKALILLLLAIASPVSFAATLEGQERGAGSMILADIEQVASDAMRAIEDERESNREIPSAELRQALSFAKFKVVDKLAPIDGSEVDASNDPATGEIWIVGNRWTSMNISQKTKLVIHELLGLARLPDPGYTLSEILMGLALPVQPAIATVNDSAFPIDDIFSNWNMRIRGNSGLDALGWKRESCDREGNRDCSIWKLKPTEANVRAGLSPNDLIVLKFTEYKKGISVMELLPESSIGGYTVRENMLRCTKPDFDNQPCFELKAKISTDSFSLLYEGNGTSNFDEDTYELVIGLLYSPRGLPSVWTVKTRFRSDDGSNIRSNFQGSSLGN